MLPSYKAIAISTIICLEFISLSISLKNKEYSTGIDDKSNSTQLDRYEIHYKKIKIKIQILNTYINFKVRERSRERKRNDGSCRT